MGIKVLEKENDDDLCDNIVNSDSTSLEAPKLNEIFILQETVADFCKFQLKFTTKNHFSLDQ